MTTTTNFYDALLAIRDKNITSRWNFPEAVGSNRSNPAGIGSPVQVSYSFATKIPSYYSETEVTSFKAFNNQEIAATKAALNHISTFTNVTFTHDTTGNGQIVFGKMEMTSTGNGRYPTFSYSYNPQTNIILSVDPLQKSGDVWINSQYEFLDYDQGSQFYGVVLHEMGHAFGLKHPFEANYNDILHPDYDNTAYTVMSYTDLDITPVRTYPKSEGVYTRLQVEPGTMMPFDIASLQFLYGENKRFNTGNNQYIFSEDKGFIQTLWDAGGTDTISFTSFSQRCNIDLREGAISQVATLSDNPSVSGYQFETSLLGIAYRTTIENASGGNGNDKITGNDLANTLMGGPGNDTISGLAGNDIINGELGADSMTGGPGNDSYGVDNISDAVVEAANEGTDTIYSTLTWTLGVNLENLILLGSGALEGTGNSLNNTLAGNAGGNVLNGLGGNDVLLGYNGHDTLYGNDGNDFLAGNLGNDVLEGGDGNDNLFGGPGADIMRGGKGNDVHVIDNAEDVAEENPNEGADTIYASLPWTLGANLENLILIGTGPLQGNGNTLPNTLAGNAGNNVLNGFGGNDILLGYGGDDAIHGGDGNDYASGGQGNDVQNGGDGADILSGGEGNDTLNGQNGHDVLAGGPGSDRFLFNTAIGATNIDRIADFAHAVDRIVLDSSIFTKIGAPGALSAAAFRKGAGVKAAGDGDDRIILDTSNGSLLYDADGTGSASSAIQFATLMGTSAGSISSTDFLVVV